LNEISGRLRVFAHLLNAHTAGQLFFYLRRASFMGKKLKAVEHKKSTRTHLFLCMLPRRMCGFKNYSRQTNTTHQAVVHAFLSFLWSPLIREN
jgi:hypothetical protein